MGTAISQKRAARKGSKALGKVFLALLLGALSAAPLSLRAAQQTLFTDSFSGTLSQWNTIGGCQIQSGQLHVPISQDFIHTNVNSTMWTDYTVEMTVNIQAVAAGIVFRSQDANDYYMWQLNVTSTDPKDAQESRRDLYGAEAGFL